MSLPLLPKEFESVKHVGQHIIDNCIDWKAASARADMFKLLKDHPHKIDFDALETNPHPEASELLKLRGSVQEPKPLVLPTPEPEPEPLVEE